LIYTLDTNVMIDISNGRAGVRARFDEAVKAGAEIVTCPIASHEFVFGCLISSRPQFHLERARQLLTDLRIIDWSHADGVAAAEVRVALRRRGRAIGANDALIAGQAINRGWTLVSHNLREFYPIDGLEVVDWTGPVA
jgi:tRNA(fMet)-specific endonuclease VapC